MNLLKLICLLVTSVVIISSCGEDCEPGTIDSNIIGTWETDAVGTSQAGTVTFNSNGTGSSTEDSVFWAELNGEGSGDFDWSYSEVENAIIVDWNFSSGGLGSDYGVVEFDCDEITLNFFLNFTLRRQ